MKLTNTMRDAYVRAILDDVPYADYEEQVRMLAQKAVIDAMPAKLRAVWDDTALRECVEMRWVRVADRMPAAVPYYPGYDEAPLASVREQCAALHALHHEQHRVRHELKTKLYAVARSATTRKALADMLPEFEKYLPADDRTACRTVPAVANVVAELVAAGWPKA